MVKKTGFLLYGYEDIEPNDAETPMRLREATIVVNSEGARALGEFLIRCAEEMGRGTGYWHEHYNGGAIPDLIVARAPADEKEPSSPSVKRPRRIRTS